MAEAVTKDTRTKTSMQNRNNDNIVKDNTTSYISRSDYFGGRNTIAEAVDKEPIIKANIRTQKNNSTDKDDMSFFISKLSASRDRNTIANEAAERNQHGENVP